MITINEYLLSKHHTNKLNSKDIIEADNYTIDDIVKDQIQLLGNDANLNHINVSKVTNFNRLFRLTLFEGDVSEWDVSNAEMMNEMFLGCTKFNCDLSNWNVEKVRFFDRTFGLCMKFEGKGLENWKINDHVESMNKMFCQCSKFNADISDWEVLACKHFDGMFKDCKEFNQDLSKWVINRYSSKFEMFKNCPLARKQKMQPKTI